MGNRLLTFQWQHEIKNSFLVFVFGPGLDSISPSISKIKNTKSLIIEKGEKNQNFYVKVIKMFFIRGITALTLP